MSDTYGSTITVAANTWVDVAATYTALAGTAGWVENLSTTNILVAFSQSATAPTSKTGSQLSYGQVATGTAPHVWVYAYGAAATIGAGLSTAAGGGSGNASVGTVGAASPGYADTIGVVDQSGELRTAAGAVFHNADNQTLAGSTFGVLTGGVAQLINQSGAIDRQRETGVDGIPSAGVAAGAQQMAGPPMATTVTSGAINGSTNTQTVTLAALSFTNRGVTSSIQVGSTVVVDTGSSQEYVFVTGVNTGASTITGVFQKNHAANVAVFAFAYNQARDATIPDGSAPAGIAASGTYLFNNNTATVEFERSAAGELDGASGTGTNVAAEYEFNAGGPLNSSGNPSGLSFDRARNLQAKGSGGSTLNGAVSAAATSITLNAATGLLPGMQIRLDRGTGSEEATYVAPSYTPGSLTVALQTALVNAHSSAATVDWDMFASAGPGLSGFTPVGIGIEEEALYDPVTSKYYIERAATQDACPPQNVVLESPGLWNGTSIDRWRSTAGAQGTTGTGVGAVGPLAQYNTTPPTLTTGQFGALQADSSGNLLVNLKTGLPTSANDIGYVFVNYSGGSGGSSIASILSPATPAAAAIKASAGRFLGFYLTNSASSLRSVKIFNSLVAGVTLGTTAAIFEIDIPAGGSATFSLEGGAYFGTGISWAVTAGKGLTDNTSTGLAANDVSGSVFYA